MAKQKTEVLFGFHSVYEALRAAKRQFEVVLISSKRGSGRADKVIKLAEKNGIAIEYTDPKELDKLTQFAPHQGIVARASFFPTKNAREILSEIQKRETPYFILITESIEDPHNLGALIRTALCADVDYIMIPKDRSCLPSSTVSRSSAGAMEHAKIFMITNTASILRDLKENGAWVFGLDADGSKGLYESDLTGNIALVIGGEHKGIRPGVKKECDFILSIPISGKINSLNASVAGGVAMYEAKRQRIVQFIPKGK
ncbi:MAG: 23S rRNA (guanosine(2251)-2'-O)-methyltransferase RlmB [Desulfobacteraceae bacterium]|nr:23S rRNA (guanosine(2251)-2'-O)-methyltransferase RlmB [Desulfobacteraceae bacterium]